MAAATFILSIFLFAWAFVAMARAKRQGDPDAGTALVTYPAIIALATGLFVYAYLYTWCDGLRTYDVETVYSVACLFMVANVFTIWRFTFIEQPRTKH